MKVAKIISTIVVAITLLCLYSWMVFHVSTYGQLLGPLTKPLLNFASFPSRVMAVMDSPEVQNEPENYLPIPEHCASINKLKQPLYGLNAFWNQQDYLWEVKLLDLQKEELIYKWQYNNKNYSDKNYQFPNARLIHSLLLPSNNIIIKPDQTAHLIRLDGNSKQVWMNQDFRYHHSMELDAEGDLWVCASQHWAEYDDCGLGGSVKNLDGKQFTFLDNLIVKVDTSNGQVLWQKSMAEIFIENDLDGMMISSNNRDPFHLNDIQPILEDGPFWKKGDLLLSVRNRAAIVLYRPASNKILKIVQGKFLYQHDVDVLNENEILIFNNNVSVFGMLKPCASETDNVLELKNSNMVTYNFETEQFSYPALALFQRNGIKTAFEGRSEQLSDGSFFVEETKGGRYFIFKDGEEIYQHCYKVEDYEGVHLPNWMRIYENLPTGF